MNGRLDANFVDLGEQSLKNIARPVRVYRIALDEVRPQTAAPATAAHVVLALPDKPSIAVLPFNNMSGDPEQEYFADGMVEDIITALSRFKELFVIARNSTFRLQGQASRYPASRARNGSALCARRQRAQGRQSRPHHGQLIDAATRAHLWADKFDGSLEDVFALQDAITESVVGALAPSLHKAELERARRKPPTNLNAYDYLLRAIPHVFANTPAATGEAIRLLTEALRLDPDYAYAHAMLANSYGQIFRSAVGQERADAQRAAEEHACVSAWNKDPVSGVIGIQSGPPG